MTKRAHLMRTATQTPEKLPDDIVESVVDIWNRKSRDGRMPCPPKETLKSTK
jgi:hypothetical protein